MQIVVAIKQVPDTSEIRIDPKTGNLIREGVESIINPDDRHAIEAALQIREKLGGRVIGISMGPPQAIDAISEALALGIDKGVLLVDKYFAGADTWATSFTLGRAVEKIGNWDLIICGHQAIDGDTAQVGPQLAEYLNIPQVTYVMDIEETTDKKIVVKRMAGNAYERIECPLPALITVMRELNEPRFPRFDWLVNACQEKAPIEIWNAADLGVKAEEVGLQGSLTNVINTFSPKTERRGKILEGTAEQIVEDLVKILKENRLA
ncbi:MAG: electron transfer flavoprotein subunit beta/FixA family protein [Deltaproteobacteria bacterium]|nr:electron transfer flavoprotein subunit beta/FixA family protein [Deltaproteobacteria bacterium]MBW1933226.1 electron transfer flavoprotein subunit beta/FixA family protein [Deltaproteobacteria bacterium]